MAGRRKPIALVEDVDHHSLAEKLGIKSGDVIKSVNGKGLLDIIDYQYLSADDHLQLEWETMAGKKKTASVDKNFDQDLGIRFTSAVFDGIRSCKNRCLFCFVDQMPKKRRKSLYVKDDDYRMSFLYGNYITLSNLDEEDFERILAERLSPLYISIHAVDPALRAKLLGVKEKAPLLDQLRRLAAGRIRMHGQVVLCPGINDGKALAETVAAVAGLGDAFESLALVPVGLTRFQKNKELHPYDTAGAAAILDAVKIWQADYVKERGSRFVFAADEFYLLATADIPEEEEYEGYPQIENGVGLIRQFWEDLAYEENDLPRFLPRTEELTLISSTDGARVLNHNIGVFAKVRGLNIRVLPVKNQFFGSTVTVTGLLTGEDIIAAIAADNEPQHTYVLPDIVLKHGETLLLDDISVEEIRARTGRKIAVVPADAAGLADYIRGLA